jgi:hypothetical protein
VVDLGALLCVDSGTATLIECVAAGALVGVGSTNETFPVCGLILCEDLPQLRLLLRTEIAVEQFRVGTDEPLPNPLLNATGG